MHPKETTTPNVPNQKQKHSRARTASFHAQDCMFQRIRARTHQDSNTTLVLTHLRNCLLQSHRTVNNGCNLPWALKHHSLPFQQFQSLLTLYSKSFSCFPYWHLVAIGFSLKVDLGENYHQLRVPIPRNVTRKTHPVYKGPHNPDRHATFLETPFSNTSRCAHLLG